MHFSLFGEQKWGVCLSSYLSSFSIPLFIQNLPLWLVSGQQGHKTIIKVWACSRGQVLCFQWSVHYYNREYTAYKIAWACTFISIKIKTHAHNCGVVACFLTPSTLSQTKLFTYGSHNWTANIRHISTLFLYTHTPPLPNSEYMYTNICVRTRTQAQFIHRFRSV